MTIPYLTLGAKTCLPVTYNITLFLYYLFLILTIFLQVFNIFLHFIDFDIIK